MAKRKAKIAIIMGKSSTGKDTIYKLLIKMTNLKEIVPYTSRPPRSNEVEGKDYFFVTEEYFKENKDKVIESRTYDTIYGPWTYGEMNDGQINDESEYDYLLVTTLEGYKGFLKHFDKGCVVPIYIEVDDGIRLQRALDRERSQENPKYTELCRRYLADTEDFSEDKLAELDIENRVENNEIEDTIAKILKKLDEKGFKY